MMISPNFDVAACWPLVWALDRPSIAKNRRTSGGVDEFQSHVGELVHQ